MLGCYLIVLAGYVIIEMSRDDWQFKDTMEYFSLQVCQVFLLNFSYEIWSKPISI